MINFQLIRNFVYLRIPHKLSKIAVCKYLNCICVRRHVRRVTNTIAKAT